MNYVTAGESHGKKNVLIIDDVPSGVSLTEKDISFDLKRRSSGPGRSNRQQLETNDFTIVSGLHNNKTTGNPICIEIPNSSDVDKSCNSMPRPGHADINGVLKYNFDNCFSVSERASARETISRVVAGVVAKNTLSELGVEVYGYVKSIGSVVLEENEKNTIDLLPSITDIAMSQVMCPDKNKSQEMLEQIERARDENDSLGGQIKLVAVGLVPGLGSYSQRNLRIDSKISATLMSVPSVKGIEFGSISYQSLNVGSATLDYIVKDNETDMVSRLTNYSGGIEGGMTNGMPIVLTAKVKPVPTIKKQIKTINLDTLEETTNICDKRADVCVVPNVAVICEAELACVLVDEYQNKFGHDNINDIKLALNAYKQRIKLFN